MATENARRTYNAGRIGLHRLVDELAQFGERDDVVHARGRCPARDRPRIAALSSAFSRPENSG
jgi:hypothetical protein